MLDEGRVDAGGSPIEAEAMPGDEIEAFIIAAFEDELALAGWDVIDTTELTPELTVARVMGGS